MLHTPPRAYPTLNDAPYYNTHKGEKTPIFAAFSLPKVRFPMFHIPTNPFIFAVPT